MVVGVRGPFEPVELDGQVFELETVARPLQLLRRPGKAAAREVHRLSGLGACDDLEVDPKPLRGVDVLGDVPDVVRVIVR